MRGGPRLASGTSRFRSHRQCSFRTGMKGCLLANLDSSQKEGNFMPQTEAFHAFSNACEGLIFSIQSSSVTVEQALLVEFYCKEVLNKIAPYLPYRPPQK